MKKMILLILIFKVCTLNIFALIPSISYEEQAKEFYNLGEEKSRLGKYQEAVDNYNKAIAYFAEYAEAYESRANAYNQLEKYERAIQDCNKAIEINSINRGRPYAIRGASKYMLKRYQKAIEDFNKATEIDPNYEFAYRFNGYANDELGNYEVALNNFNKAIQLNPSNKDINLRIEKLKSKLKYHKMIENGNLIIYESYKDITYDKLTNAVKNNDFKTVKSLVENGANINIFYIHKDYYDSKNFEEIQSPLYYAIQENNYVITEYLISKGADVNYNNGALFERFLKDASLNILKLLIQNKIQFNSTYYMNVILKEFNEKSAMEIIETMFVNGYNPNLFNHLSGNTSMHYFITEYFNYSWGNDRTQFRKKNLKEVLKLFIKFGLDLKIENNKGETLLILAQNIGDNELIEFLKNAESNLNKKDPSTKTKSKTKSKK